MSRLTWYPYSPAEWRQRTEGLSDEERGALRRVLDESWERTPPCTIADTPAEMQLLLGSRRKTLEPLIRLHFTTDPEHPGRLRCEWFWALHKQQLEKYESYARRGGEGGRTKSMNTTRARKKGQTNLFPAEKRPRRSSSASSSATITPLAQLLAQPVVQLPQKLDSSLEPRTGAAVAVASGAPAAPQTWVGPDFDQLRSWADQDPEISRAVVNRVANLVQHIPAGVQVPAMRRLYETEALQAEYLARQAGPEVPPT